MADPLMYRVREAAELLSVSRSTVYTLIHQGALRTVRVGSEMRVTERALAAYVHGLEMEAEMLAKPSHRRRRAIAATARAR